MSSTDNSEVRPDLHLHGTNPFNNNLSRIADSLANEPLLVPPLARGPPGRNPTLCSTGDILV